MKIIKHKFVQFIPENIEDNVLYITIEYSTAVHKCCCGCGNKVVTPFSPTDWKLIFDGDTISLYPSIGNWSFECKSHYWITNNKIIWDEKWSDEMININRLQDQINKDKYYSSKIINKYKNVHKNNSVSIIKIFKQKLYSWFK